MSDEQMMYKVSLKIEGITLPPVQDILILGRNCPHGPKSIGRCFSLLSTEEFNTVIVDDAHVQAILVNRKILQRMPEAEVVRILRQRAFPFISADEVVRVEFRVVLAYDNLSIPAAIGSEDRDK